MLAEAGVVPDTVGVALFGSAAVHGREAHERNRPCFAEET